MRILKNKDYTRFLLGETLALFGYFTLQMAISLFLLDITESATKFASAFIINTAPALVFGLFAGVIVDKINKKKLLVFLDLLRAVVLGVAFFLPLNEYAIYALLLFLGTCNVFFTPAFVTVLPNILDKEDLVEGNSIKNTVLEGGKVAAPILGALLYSLLGIEMVILLTSLFFLFSAFVLKDLQIKTKEAEKNSNSILTDLREGFTVFRDGRLTSLVINGMLTHIFLTAIFYMGFPFLIKNVFDGSDLDVGVVESVATIGIVLSVFAVTAVKNKITVGHGIFYGIIGMIVTVIPLFLLGIEAVVGYISRVPMGHLVFFSIVTFGMFWVRGFYGAFFVAFYQQNVEASKLGRFFSVMSLLFALGQILGYQLFGYLFDSHSLIVSIVILGIGVVLKAVVHIPFMILDRKQLVEVDMAVRSESST
ncbi:MFS transporter [Bacillus sp. 31A1R]|uniref:MFS transporter n=1 Tax=Robertmurraya mangrovi TaxID=3098077 RepID=A0ABU5J3P9_9BACI|nr:MFS transporter [Bacillus sp. 31A1R]MDZ5474045.1 MFS transporter [Bacillus sp. 31A1R]